MSLEVARSTPIISPLTSDEANNRYFGGSALSSQDSGAAGKVGGGGPISYGGPADSPSSLSSGKAGQGTGQGASDDSLSDMVKDLVNQIVQAILNHLQQNNQSGDATNSNSSGSSPSGVGSGSGSGSSGAAAQDLAQSPAAAPAAAATPDNSAVAAAPAASAAAAPASGAPAAGAPAATPAAAAAPASSAPASTSASAASSAGAGPTSGSGPYNLNITNTQDHDITVGMFDKDNKQVAKIDLAPGQTGQIKYPADSSLVAKQADSDGNFKDNASRLELYNGYVNTSDIDGRNAAIHATDGKGFEIGDTKSIADGASDAISSKDSAGNKTIDGFYDGSTAQMKDGANYMINALSKDGQSATGETYFHPNDDTLGQGQNPMRHTDSMSLDVTFGKA